MIFRVCLAVFALLPFSTAFAKPQSQSAWMQVGSITSQPIGHYELCKRLPDECSVRSSSMPPPRLTQKAWEVLRQVNSEVNAAISPKTDKELYGVEEVWSYADEEGDCEDYSLLKRRALIGKGFPVRDLLLTVLRKPDGEGHAVLTVRTDQGDFVLDNLESEIKIWTATSYRYIKRQASFHSGRWVTIENDADTPVGSVE
ncbi:transglutaminase-like cysteine peptidase [Ensifer sp. P24N7]|uniref:transglutaminase-like cysteine peptidase n=1 Tax=Sinorhizobium sp. P24N7 TaxID=3348358 RepID=UPI0035F3326D